MAVGDDILAQMAQVAFDPFEDIDAQQQKLQDAQKRAEILERAERIRQAAIVKAALDNTAGRAFMAWLETKTLKLPASAEMINATSVEAYAMRALRREGAAQLYLTIQEALSVDLTTTEDENV